VLSFQFVEHAGVRAVLVAVLADTLGHQLHLGPTLGAQVVVRRIVHTLKRFFEDARAGPLCHVAQAPVRVRKADRSVLLTRCASESLSRRAAQLVRTLPVNGFFRGHLRVASIDPEDDVLRRLEQRGSCSRIVVIAASDTDAHRRLSHVLGRTHSKFLNFERWTLFLQCV
jgi:hypothetical protein